ncbi:MAG: metal-dependent hydrolase [Acidobacteriales bacterium]|nr:metal-dependent hydrolase [Terriglobales bacterium]
MDPVTHLLFGANMGRAGLNRKSGLATLTLVLASEAPDIDIFFHPFDRVEAFGVHRGFTHSFLYAPLIAAMALAAVYGIHRWRLKRGKSTTVPVDWKWLYGLALLSVLSHLLLDFTNNYGLRPFAPFDRQWYACDTVSIIEPAITGALVMALIASGFGRLIGGEIGVKRAKLPGRVAAMTALVFVILVWGVRDYNHRRAVTLLEHELYQGAEPVKLSANPYPLDPFRWHGVVETENAFVIVTVNTWKEEVDPQRDAVYRNMREETPMAHAAKQSRLGQIYLDWARHPYIETEPLPDERGWVVYFNDLRYAYPGRSNRCGFPVMSVELDKQLNVIRQSTGPRLEDCED